MIGLIQSKAITILSFLIIALVLFSAILYLRLNFANKQIDRYKIDLGAIEAQSKAAEIKHKERVDSYEYAVDEIAKYYDETLTEIESFTKDENETDCDSANRFLNSIKY